MKTFSYIKGTIEKIKIGKSYYYGQLVNGDGDLDELLQSGCVAVYDEKSEEEKIVEFKILENNQNILDTLVMVLEIR